MVLSIYCLFGLPLIDVGAGGGGTGALAIAINKEVSFLFQKCPFFLRKRAPSECRATKIEMLPATLLPLLLLSYKTDSMTIPGQAFTLSN